MFSTSVEKELERTLRTEDKAQAKFLLEMLHKAPLPTAFWPKPTRTNPSDLSSIAFSFDIDGVLVKGAVPLPHSSETIYLLQRMKIPFIFLTNGGGISEEAHVKKLENRFNIILDTRQFIQSHSPFLDFVPELHDRTVLVLGGEHENAIREVAHTYGFEKVVTAADILAAFPTVSPFCEISKEPLTKLARPLPETPLIVSAILIFSSPREMGLDLQIVRDLLLSEKGKLGTLSPLNGNPDLPNHGYQQDGQPSLQFCNPDLLWPTEYPLLRFAQGSFKAALTGIWAAETQGKAQLISHTVGKPEYATYVYAEKKLLEYQAALNGPEVKVSAIAMIDDNPLSGIKGANDYDVTNFTPDSSPKWKSVLVETGVYVAGTKPAIEPTTTQKDVKQSISWVLAQEGWALSEEAWNWAADIASAIKKLQPVINST